MPDFSHTEIKQDMLTNLRYAALFAPYHPEAVAKFAANYAINKFQWQYHGAQAEFDQTDALSRCSEAAYNRLWDIQRKKLFDLQCRWRAGHVTGPGLDCTFDFARYDVAIENCPVLDPISPEELAMYCDFVRQAADFDEDVLDCYGGDFGLPRDWQDYDKMRLHEQEEAQNTPDEACKGVRPPAWYDYHNSRTGHGFLLSLPDLRGPREKPYLDAYYAHRRAKGPGPASPPPTDPRPRFLTFEQEETLQHALLHRFESPKLRRQQAAYAAQKDREAADEQVEADFAYLKALDPGETVPLAPAADWRAALRQAVVETQRHQLLAHLPQVYEAYRMRQDLNISHPEAEEPTWRSDLGHCMRESLLDGRELLGEPRTFDF
ncbi:hypothetical protein [Hymenobacter terricola]|uniref:hypothetical protein n=1 Tax=Hymenobacter terricola TaxID=2819236 RepID=UPI001B3066D0|nr:hypothetical protein [Hymenobacter terricola]